MSWTELLKREIGSAYKTTEGLLELVEEDTLNWKPSMGSNWMTTGQLLHHIITSCGMSFQGFVTGDWGLPEGVDISKLSPEEMLPPAEKMPTIESVAEAKKLLAADKKLALDVLAKIPEDDLAHKPAPAPWDPSDMILGHRLLQMVYHLNSHKGQLFYYLKLQGKPVDTGHLWGM
ncbi:MAG: DinB family protein [Candidatus Latescibacteria bacterium]|nr:DinB family protein [Candidatus Latescibacterota bacterium]NIO29048.1 DinB family protein [Candidatus Latescibacterota bacterium]NIO56673.1 DinB family protein [Candidatus Latescibacterota bacterium]NIT02256.1 DinB family protein [Candidatus Latescibacterota bacterium]NIT39141.1 DinB family protein [Candidatus Latescibacterota bacterium]